MQASLKPVNNIWPNICRFDNLLAAYLKARKGKRGRADVALFELNREAELFTLQQELLTGGYQPGTYRQFEIYEKKSRTISAAPFRDRVVHHGIMLQLQPLLEPLLHKHCYACRKGFGVHKAVNQYAAWAQRYDYVLKLDVQRYFPTVDQHLLLQQLHHVINDAPLMDVLTRIVHSYPTTVAGKGMAIGNLTSQFFANWYLQSVDHFVADELVCSAYLRYVDDLFVFANSKAQLWHIKQHVERQLDTLDLQIHQHKAVVCRTSEKVPVLGYQISRNKRWLQSANGKQATKKIRRQAQQCQQGNTTFTEVKPSIHAWIGHAMHGQTSGLRRKLFSNLQFTPKQR